MASTGTVQPQTNSVPAPSASSSLSWLSGGVGKPSMINRKALSPAMVPPQVPCWATVCTSTRSHRSPCLARFDWLGSSALSLWSAPASRSTSAVGDRERAGRRLAAALERDRAGARHRDGDRVGVVGNGAVERQAGRHAAGLGHHERGAVELLGRLDREGHRQLVGHARLDGHARAEGDPFGVDGRPVGQLERQDLDVDPIAGVVELGGDRGVDVGVRRVTGFGLVIEVGAGRGVAHRDRLHRELEVGVGDRAGQVEVDRLRLQLGWPGLRGGRRHRCGGRGGRRFGVVVAARDEPDTRDQQETEPEGSHQR